MAQCINRIDHIVWLVHAHNQEAFVEKFEKLFRTHFDGPLIRQDFGAQFWVSWEAGLEILAPWGESEYAKMWSDRLEQRGEGVLSMVFGVPNIEEACDHARQLDYQVSPITGFSGDEPWMHKLETFKQAIVGDVLGTLIGFSEIRYADGVIGNRP